MNDLYIEEYNGVYQNEQEKIKTQVDIANECLKIANDANFPTDFQDVYDHLFEDDSYIILFAKDKEDKIKGFVIACQEEGYHDCKILHIHGIVLGPEIQGRGMSKEIIDYAIDKYKPDVVTAKTHNPRCFNAFASLGGGKYLFYPNNQEIPETVREIVKSDCFINSSDENLIYRDAYPDEKIQQSKTNPLVDVIFDKVGKYDAQSIVVIVNNDILNVEKDVKKKVRKLV